MKRCKDYLYYPDNCGYWDMNRRDKNAGYVHKFTEHNCPDFKTQRIEVSK